jgi:hypothetical protein
LHNLPFCRAKLQKAGGEVTKHPLIYSKFTKPYMTQEQQNSTTFVFLTHIIKQHSKFFHKFAVQKAVLASIFRANKE